MKIDDTLLGATFICSLVATHTLAFNPVSLRGRESTVLGIFGGGNRAEQSIDWLRSDARFSPEWLQRNNTYKGKQTTIDEDGSTLQTDGFHQPGMMEQRTPAEGQPLQQAASPFQQRGMGQPPAGYMPQGQPGYQAQRGGGMPGMPGMPGFLQQMGGVPPGYPPQRGGMPPGFPGQMGGGMPPPGYPQRGGGTSPGYPEQLGAPRQYPGPRGGFPPPGAFDQRGARQPDYSEQRASGYKPGIQRGGFQPGFSEQDEEQAQKSQDDIIAMYEKNPKSVKNTGILIRMRDRNKREKIVPRHFFLSSGIVLMGSGGCQITLEGMEKVGLSDLAFAITLSQAPMASLKLTSYNADSVNLVRGRDSEVVVIRNGAENISLFQGDSIQFEDVGENPGFDIIFHNAPIDPLSPPPSAKAPEKVESDTSEVSASEESPSEVTVDAISSVTKTEPSYAVTSVTQIGSNDKTKPPAKSGVVTPAASSIEAKGTVEDTTNTTSAIELKGNVTATLGKSSAPETPVVSPSAAPVESKSNGKVPFTETTPVETPAKSDDTPTPAASTESKYVATQASPKSKKAQQAEPIKPDDTTRPPETQVPSATLSLERKRALFVVNTRIMALQLLCDEIEAAPDIETIDHIMETADTEDVVGDVARVNLADLNATSTALSLSRKRALFVVNTKIMALQLLCEEIEAASDTEALAHMMETLDEDGSVGGGAEVKLVPTSRDTQKSKRGKTASKKETTRETPIVQKSSPNDDSQQTKPNNVTSDAADNRTEAQKRPSPRIKRDELQKMQEPETVSVACRLQGVLYQWNENGRRGAFGFVRLDGSGEELYVTKQNFVNKPTQLNSPMPVLVEAIIRSTNRKPTHRDEAKIVRLLKEED